MSDRGDTGKDNVLVAGRIRQLIVEIVLFNYGLLWRFIQER